MALIHCDFFSDVLGLSVSMAVILPQTARRQVGMASAASGRRHPTLWLLHGMSDDHTIWQRRTSIERYIAPLGLAVVMPAVGRSYYADMACGPRYWTFLSEELPAVARGFFPLSDAREDNFAAGLSMGGYGAFKLALACPERFAAAASLSGALDILGLPAHVGQERDREWESIFGRLQDVPGTDNDLLHLARRLAESDRPRPALYQWCGTEDFLYEDNLRVRDALRGLGLPLEYEEGPGGHEWSAWDRMIQRVLAWLPLPAPPEGARPE
jgi:S-formylglutathione hydrolase FrmB